VYSETKKEGLWVADAARSFTMKELVTLGRAEAHMDETTIPQQPELFGLLSDEAWESLPWSYWQKGMPDDVSSEVQAVSQTWEGDGFGHNYLTLQELTEKYVELLEDPRALAQTLQKPLGEVIYTMSSDMHQVNSPEDRRIVFWFSQ
jgi:hypothetical protein